MANLSTAKSCQPTANGRKTKCPCHKMATPHLGNFGDLRLRDIGDAKAFDF